MKRSVVVAVFQVLLLHASAQELGAVEPGAVQALLLQLLPGEGLPGESSRSLPPTTLKYPTADTSMGLHC